MLEMRQNSQLIELNGPAAQCRREASGERSSSKGCECSTCWTGDPFGSSGMSSVQLLAVVGLLEVLELRNIFHKLRWGESRMAEVEEWLRSTIVFSAWLALIDESYVNELKLWLELSVICL